MIDKRAPNYIAQLENSKTMKQKKKNKGQIQFFCGENSYTLGPCKVINIFFLAGRPSRGEVGALLLLYGSPY